MYVYICNNPLIDRLLAQVGTFLIPGVAVASQVLCTSTTLNKSLFLVTYYKV